MKKIYINIILINLVVSFWFFCFFGMIGLYLVWLFYFMGKFSSVIKCRLGYFSFYLLFNRLRRVVCLEKYK